MSGSTLLLAAIALCAGIIGLLLFRASPKLTVGVWVAVLFFVPVWIGVSVGFYWAAITLVTLAALITNLSDIRLSVVDLFMALFAVMVVALYALGLATLSATVIGLLEWALPYAWGRIVLAKVSGSFLTRALATAATVAAVLALIEFMTGSNIFITFPAMSAERYGSWGTLQIRAGLLRAEGAWGHSIALGSALAMSSAFILVVRWPTIVRVLALVIVGGATVVTFSRIGMLTLALTIVLGVFFLPGVGKRMRWSVGLLSLGAAVMIIPFIDTVFAEAGDEAGGSADYRADLFSLVSQVQLFGNAGDWSGLTVGGQYLGAYARSVDNAYLLFALRFGWVPTLMLIAALVLVAIGMLRRGGANPASIAVTAQLPALIAVALITQAGMYLWFLAGVAVAWQQAATRHVADDQDDGRSRFSMSRTKDDNVFASRR